MKHFYILGATRSGCDDFRQMGVSPESCTELPTLPIFMELVSARKYTTEDIMVFFTDVPNVMRKVLNTIPEDLLPKRVIFVTQFPALLVASFRPSDKLRGCMTITSTPADVGNVC